MNNNFNHRPPVRYTLPIDTIGGKWWAGTNLIGEESKNSQYGVSILTQANLNKYMDRIFIDQSNYQVNLDTFNYYYGIHYSVASMLYMNYYGEMYENNSLKTSWGYPSVEDAKQLLAMCDVLNPDGILREQHVRADLAPKVGDNPLAFNVYTPSNHNIYWFGGSNRYNFNLMPGGARLNGPGVWYNSLGPLPGGGWNGDGGDIYHLFYTGKLTTAERDAQGVITGYGILDIHDWFTFAGKIYHWDNIRWRRKLTDEELGYKLYINADSTDIQKLAPNQSPASEYNELPNGYLRGFYVQYILDNPSPERTVEDIAYMSRVSECFNSKKVVDHPDSICVKCGICPSELQTRRSKAPESDDSRLEDISNNGVRALSVYPNPVDDVLNIDSESPVVSVKVYSSTGSLVKRTSEAGKSIDTGALTPGIYTFVIQTEKENAAFRIVKK
jgi:hypothetical protein